jgi:hypothetical protein
MKDRLLLCLAGCQDLASSVSQIRKVAEQAGMRDAKACNVSLYLARTSGLSIRTAHGWELTDAGQERVNELLGRIGRVSLSSVTVRALREHAAKLSNPDTKAFVLEAIECVGSRLYRAAVVLSWVGALSLLHQHIVTHHLIDFNTEAIRRDPKRKQAKTVDDLGRIGEYDFLQILEHISVVGKNVKAELEDCLRLRNGCGHPNPLKLGEAMVAAHVETLILNVFEKF